jgi:hypothetical protein
MERQWQKGTGIFIDGVPGKVPHECNNMVIGDRTISRETERLVPNQTRNPTRAGIVLRSKRIGLGIVLGDFVGAVDHLVQQPKRELDQKKQRRKGHTGNPVGRFLRPLGKQIRQGNGRRGEKEPDNPGTTLGGHIPEKAGANAIRPVNEHWRPTDDIGIVLPGNKRSLNLSFRLKKSKWIISRQEKWESHFAKTAVF